MGEWPYSSTHS